MKSFFPRACMIRTYRLTNAPGGLGLSCTSAGLSLAGAPLLQKTATGFAPRPKHEVAELIKTAYGEEAPARLRASLGAIAEALNRGEVARAAIIAVMTRTPELNGEAAARLAKTNEELAKYNYDPSEPRDWHGRWTRDGAAGSVNISAPVDLSPARYASELIGPRISDSERGGAEQYASAAPVASSEGEAVEEHSHEPTSPEQEFERKYDELGPVEFAKQVIEFGYRLERDGKNFSSAEKEQALAEYSFLQNRLSFWLGYPYKPATAYGNLLSAAYRLYQGAVNGGIVGVRDMPESMVDVGVGAWAIDNLPQTRTRAALPEYEIAPPSAVAPKESEDGAGLAETLTETEERPGEIGPFGEVNGLGGVVDNAEAGVNWAADQGKTWEDYLAKTLAAKRLHSLSKAFDFFKPEVREAISAKTLNTLSMVYIRNPRKIFEKLKTYIDTAADYWQPRGDIDLDPKDIESKTLHLAVHGYTSPMQWRYLHAAFAYGKKRGVSVVITRIRE